MNNLNDPLYVAAVNNARRSEQRGVELEQMAVDARRASARPRSGHGLTRLFAAAWARVARLPIRPVRRTHVEPTVKAGS